MHGAFKAIPTRYRNTNFRSRLEAKWAAFFDIVGWRWVCTEWPGKDAAAAWKEAGNKAQWKPQRAP
jgi:hypothetical protein